jgi:hypothetical protein
LSARAILAIALGVLLALAPLALRTSQAQQVKYRLSFVLSYLPRGFLWSVVINSTIFGTNYSNIINFYLSPGVYSYVIAYFNGSSGKYLSIRSGVINLNSNYTVFINVYRVDFTAAGLPEGAAYRVYINGTFLIEGTGNLSLWLPEGVYSYNASYYNSSFSQWVPLGHGVFDLNSNKTIQLTAYTVKLWPLGLPPGLEWYVVVNSSLQTPYSTGNITLLLGPGVYSYMAYSFNASTYSTGLFAKGTFAVTGNELVAVPYPTTYALTVLQQGLPSGTPWYLILNGTRLGPFYNSSITLTLRAGVYSYKVLFYYAPLKESVIESEGIIYLGSNEVLTLRPEVYNLTAVAIDESPGVSWSLVINGTTVVNLTTSAVKVLPLPAGVYRYSVIIYYGPLGTYTVASEGIINVTNNSVIQFYAGLYSLTLELQGAPQGIKWYLVLDGKEVASSTLPIITIQLPAGNYSYVVTVYYSPLSTYINVTSGRLFINGSETLVVPFYRYGVDVLFLSKPQNVTWEVLVNGIKVAEGTSQALSFTLPQGIYRVAVVAFLQVPRVNVTLWSSELNLTGNTTITMPVQFYPVSFVPASFPGGSWWLVINNTAVGPLGPQGTTLELLEGVYRVTAVYYDYPLGINVTATSELISVSSSSVLSLQFSAIRQAHVMVTGLPSGVRWELIVNGTVALPFTSAPNATLPLPSTPLVYQLVFSYPGGELREPPALAPAQGPLNIVVMSPVSVLSVALQGLPPGGAWELLVNGTPVTSWLSTGSASAYLASGPASYSILWRSANLTFRGPSGSLRLNGTVNLAVALPTSYAVTFTVPSGVSSWKLYINGTLAAGPTQARNLTVYLPSGSYAYQAVLTSSSGTLRLSGELVVPSQTSLYLGQKRPVVTGSLLAVAAVVVVAVVVAALLFVMRR